MAEEYPDKIKLYDHVPNSGICHMPGRRFPAVAIQGDSLSIILSSAIKIMGRASEMKDEEMFYEAMEIAEKIQGHLVRYETVLNKEGFEKPYMLNATELSLPNEP